jgi:type IV pilus assembly protein PilN
MIRINLLPYREKEKKESLQRQIVLFAGSMVLVVLVLVAVFFYFSITVGSLEKRIAEAHARLALLDRKVGDIEGFKRDKKELEQKLGVINTLEGNRIFPVRMLDELNMLVPAKEIWLERLTETGQELRIEGMAKDNGTVALFMKNLEKASFVKTVDLVVSREKDVAGTKLQQFILTCGIKRGT